MRLGTNRFAITLCLDRIWLVVVRNGGFPWQQTNQEVLNRDWSSITIGRPRSYAIANQGFGSKIAIGLGREEELTEIA